jgi:hypothetical protein
VVQFVVQVVVVVLGACQKFPQPARNQTERPTSAGAASSNHCRALLPMFITAPMLSFSPVDRS